jgi:FHS family L-fucose permease-like MFS transporter
MAIAPLTLSQSNPPIETSDSTRRTGLIAVTTLFFMWGFLTCLNDILVPHLKSVFDLNYVRASLIQFTFFGAYFLMSIPAGKVIAVMGYQRSMVAGLPAAAGTDGAIERSAASPVAESQGEMLRSTIFHQNAVVTGCHGP